MLGILILIVYTKKRKNLIIQDEFELNLANSQSYFAIIIVTTILGPFRITSRRRILIPKQEGQIKRTGGMSDELKELDQRSFGS